MNADVVVVGAGIIGAAISRQLTRAGVDVVLLDAGEVGSGSSGRCDGNVLVQTKHDELGIRMAQHSLAGYRQWARELDMSTHFHQSGSLVFFTDENDAGAQRVDWLRRTGVNAQFVDAAAIRSLEPNLSPAVVGGIDCPEDGSVYPPSVVAALVHDARRHGCRVLTHTSATRLLASADGRVDGVETSAGVIRAPFVVNAMGSWAAQLDGDPGIHIPVAPRQGVLVVTDEAPGLVNRAVTEGTYMSTRVSGGEGEIASVALVAEPTFRRNVLIGSTRRFCGHDVAVDMALLTRMLARAVSLLPALANVTLLRSFAGLRPWTPDNRPLIGASRTLPGYLLATGHEGEGIGLAPVTADAITALVTGAAPSALLEQVLAAADPHRFALAGVPS